MQRDSNYSSYVPITSNAIRVENCRLAEKVTQDVIRLFPSQVIVKGTGNRFTVLLSCLRLKK